MSRNSFQFKRFTVEQEGCAMKVGTDGVLLGVWCRVEPTDEAILDIGTGTGVIALQLAQRTESNYRLSSGTQSIENPALPCSHSNRPCVDPAKTLILCNAMIYAVEIDPIAGKQASLNFQASPWYDRLHLYNMSVQDFASHIVDIDRHTMSRTIVDECFSMPTTMSHYGGDCAAFDHIVSNPPYFVDSLSSPVAARNTARHAAQLPYEDIIDVCDRLLRPTGRVSLILPAGTETTKMLAIAAARGFVPSRLTDVHSTPKSGPKRTLIEFLRADGTEIPIETASIVIEDAGPGTFSAEYRALTHDFYLYF